MGDDGLCVDDGDVSVGSLLSDYTASHPGRSLAANCHNPRVTAKPRPSPRSSPRGMQSTPGAVPVSNASSVTYHLDNEAASMSSSREPSEFDTDSVREDSTVVSQTCAAARRIM